ncbi:ubiquitin carboxyl-terminal hydrolase 37-like [Xyrichtys novacula]|uniref:Ubiquitin carboxyl-terminal hydrolase n=1 Tax=Xyrichtys novacula TaxID=13765 RepID=A0AAV1FBW5_XYRNO|nr:ubiquitin carboxyl-terminal hydrolase 37-like [Xyrichtys novacula]
MLDRKAKKNQPTPVSGEAPRIVCSSFNKGVTVLEASNTENCNPQLSWLRRLFRRPLRKDGLAGSTAPPPGEKNNQPKKKKWSSRLFNCCSKNQPTPVSGEAPRIVCSSFNKGVTVLEASNTENCNPQLSWLRRLFRRPLRKDGLAGSTAPPPGEKNNQPKKKKWSSRLFNCCSRKNRVTPLSDHEDEQKPLQKLQRSLVKEKSHQAGDSVLVLEDFREDEEEKPRQQEKKLTVPFAQQTVIASSAKEKANVEDNLVKEKSHQAGDSVLVSEDEEEKPRQQEKKLTVPFAQQTVIASSAKEKANVEDNLVKEKSHQAGDSVLVLEDFREDEEEKPRQQEKKLTVPFAQQTVIASSAKEKANVEDNLVKEKSHQAGDSVLVSEDEEEKPRQQEKKLTVPFAQQTVIASSAKEKANVEDNLVKEKSHQAGDSVLVLEDFREDEEEKPRQQEKKLTVPFAQQTVIASSAKEKANVEDNLVKEKSHQAGDSVLVSEDEEEKPRQQEKKLTVPFAQQTVIASSAKEKANVEDNLVKEKSHQAGDSVLVLENFREDEEEKPRQQEKKLTVPFAQQTVIASSAKEKANVEDNLVKEKSHQAGDSVLVSEDEEEKPRQQEKKLTVPFAQQTVIASSAKEKANVEDNTDKVSQRRLSQWEQRLTCWQINLGFPNPAQNCYMNSSLQSLLTLTQFVRDIRSQEEVWSVFPEAQLMSYFMDIACLRDVGDRRRKLEALCELKRIISVKAPEFVDNHQKDAHEFLIAVLGQMRDLAAPLGQVASILGRTYSCPVERNLVFKMQNTRKCKRCGSPSVREEEFLNLSLDLIPGGSVQQMLEEYEKETDLEFSCKCGGKTSAQCSTFTTLPNFLVLQLKRFNFTETYELVKCHDPVDLTRELIVTSSQAKSWYSLVSVISHLGSEGNAGHYISSGLHPDMDPETTGDLWLNYNDSEVTCMTRENVCQSLEESAYLLFYQKMV